MIGLVAATSAGQLGRAACAMACRGTTACEMSCEPSKMSLRGEVRSCVYQESSQREPFTKTEKWRRKRNLLRWDLTDTACMHTCGTARPYEKRGIYRRTDALRRRPPPSHCGERRLRTSTALEAWLADGSVGSSCCSRGLMTQRYLSHPGCVSWERTAAQPIGAKPTLRKSGKVDVAEKPKDEQNERESRTSLRHRPHQASFSK